MPSFESKLSKRGRWYAPSKMTSPLNDEGNAPGFQTQRNRPDNIQLNLGPLKKKKQLDIDVEHDEEEESLENEDIQEYQEFQARERGSQSQFGAGYGDPNFLSRTMR